MPADYSAELATDLAEVLRRTTALTGEASTAAIEDILAAVSTYKNDRAREKNGAGIRGWLDDTAKKAAELRAWLDAGPPPRGRLSAAFRSELHEKRTQARDVLEELVGWISWVHDPWQENHRPIDSTRRSLDSDVGCVLFHAGIRPTGAPDGAFASLLQKVYGDLGETLSPAKGARAAVETHPEWRLPRSSPI